MKLSEVINIDDIARILDLDTPDKQRDAKTLVKLRRKKADSRNRRNPKNTQASTYANHDGLAGYEPTSNGIVNGTNNP